MGRLPPPAQPGPRRRMLRSTFSLALILAGASWALLALVGAALLQPSPSRSQGVAIAATSLPGDCIFLQVGNPEPATVRVDFEWEREYGVERPAIDPNISLAPWASKVIEFRTPAPGAGVRLLSSSTALQARVEVVPDGEATPEYRRAHWCLGPQTDKGGEADMRGGGRSRVMA